MTKIRILYITYCDYILLKFCYIEKCSDKIVETIKNTCFIFNIFLENCAVCETMWKKFGTARQDTDDDIIWHMRFACRIIKAIDIHSVYVGLVALPRQICLCERVTMQVLCLSCSY